MSKTDKKRIEFIEGAYGYVVGDTVFLPASVADGLVDKNKAVYAALSAEEVESELDEMIASYRQEGLGYAKSVSLAFQLAQDRDLEPPVDKQKATIETFLSEHLD